MMKKVRVACGQIVCKIRDVEENLQQMEALAKQAAGKGARLILFAEGALTGYRFSDDIKAIAPDPDGSAVQRLKAVAAELDIVMCVGCVLRVEDVYHVSHLIVRPDGRLQVQHKHNLTPNELKHDIQRGAEERLIFEVDGVTFAIVICADGGIEDIKNKLARAGCQVMLAPTAGGGGRDHMCREADLEDEETWPAYLKDQENVCFVGSASQSCWQHRMAILACNLAGDDGVDDYHAGHSCMVDSRGALQGLIPGEYVKEFQRPQLLVGDVVVQEPRCWPAE